MNKIKGSILIVAFLGLLNLFYPATAGATDAYTVIENDVSTYNEDADQVTWITQAICYASSMYQVDSLLITAVMENESQFSFYTFQKPSSAGAIGLMQLMPDTAMAIGVNPYDPLGNVIGGASYLRTMLDDFSGSGAYAVTNAIAAYNAGPQAVKRYGGCPPFGETYGYVINVANSYQKLLSNYYT